jgi:hypothetical protein
VLRRSSRKIHPMFSWCVPMRRNLIICIAVGFVVSLVPQPVEAQTLDETREWIARNFDWNNEVREYDGVTKRSVELLSFDGCTLSWHYIYDGAFSFAKYAHRIDLGRLNLSSIGIVRDQGGAYIEMKTFNRMNSVHFESTRQSFGSNPTSRTTSVGWQDVAHIRILDKPSDQRLLNALRHAAQLCGAKDEPF